MSFIFLLPVARAAEQSLGLSQQIANFYQWALGIGGLVALGIIVFGGILYTVSAGNASKQDDAKQWITGALIGLLLLFGSYLILNTINPELTKLNDLKLIVNEAAQKTSTPPSPSDPNLTYSSSTSAGNPTPVCWSEFECRIYYDRYCRGKSDCEGVISGVLPFGETIPFPSNIFGVSSAPGVRTTSNLIEGLQKAGAEAIKQGHSLRVASGYRSLKRQLEIALDPELGGFSRVPDLVARPGGSNHGSGRAVDIYLDGKSQDAHTTTDCRILAKIMYAAGWERYEGEFWHFEYPAGAGNPYTRSTNRDDCAGA